MVSHEALVIQNLSKTFKSKDGKIINALDNITANFSSGNIIGLLGKNGAGKTTFIKSCCNLLTYEGNIIYPNTDKKIPYAAVLEGNRNIFWKLTVLENIMYFASLRFMKKQEIMPRVNALLKHLYLTGKKDELVENLSKGMKQKTALICSLVLDVPVLFLDEPSTGLDVESTEQMIAFLNNKEFIENKLIIVTSHIFEFMERVVDKYLVINKGRISSPTNVSQQQAHLIEITLKGTNLNMKEIISDEFKLVDKVETKDSTILTLSSKNEIKISKILARLEKTNNKISAVKELTNNMRRCYLNKCKEEF